MHTGSTEATSSRRRLLLPAALLRMASDERLVAELRAGSERAFEILFDRHYLPLLGFCRHLLGSLDEAEDAVQLTFLAAHRDLMGSEKPIVARPWLYTIARHRCVSILRARRERPVDEIRQPAAENPAVDVSVREDLRALLADLGQLPEEQRAALVLMELGDLSHKEIAGVLDCPRDKVKSLVFMARSSLAASRTARDTPCWAIREQLAAPNRAGLSRTAIRRHLLACTACRGFRADVRTQRRDLALVLPVVASPALRASVLATVSGAGAGTGAGAGAGSAAVAGGALLSGELTAKALVAVAIAGGGGVASATTMGSADHVSQTRSAPTAPVFVETADHRIAERRRKAVDTPADATANSRSKQPPSGRHTDRSIDRGHSGAVTQPRSTSAPYSAEPPIDGETNGRGRNTREQADPGRAEDQPQPPTRGQERTKPEKSGTSSSSANDKPARRDQGGGDTNPGRTPNPGTPGPNRVARRDKAGNGGGANKPAGAGKPGGADKPDSASNPGKPVTQSRAEKLSKSVDGNAAAPSSEIVDAKPAEPNPAAGAEKVASPDVANATKPFHGSGAEEPQSSAQSGSRFGPSR